MGLAFFLELEGTTRLPSCDFICSDLALIYSYLAGLRHLVALSLLGNFILWEGKGRGLVAGWSGLVWWVGYLGWAGGGNGSGPDSNRDPCVFGKDGRMGFFSRDCLNGMDAHTD